MGRPSLVAVRRGRILAATIECMATHGLGGTTLERLADMTGMSRGHIRHYVGNRDELLIDSARAFFFSGHSVGEQEFATAATNRSMLDPSAPLEEAFDFLFGPFAEPNAENPAAYAFVDAGRTIPAVREILVSAYLAMQESLTQILRRAYPDADEDAIRRAAYGTLTIAIGNSFITDIAVSDERMEDARAVAEQLVARLADACCP